SQGQVTKRSHATTRIHCPLRRYSGSAVIQHRANKPVPKNQVQGTQPHPLVDPGNPSDSPTSRTNAHTTSARHRMVALTQPVRPSHKIPISKITTVMLARTPKCREITGCISLTESRRRVGVGQFRDL